MTAVFGVSIGATSVRMARTTGATDPDAATSNDDDTALSFEKRVIDVGRASPVRVAARAVRSLVDAEGPDTPVVVTYTDAAQSEALRTELESENLERIGVMGEARAAMELIGLSRIVDGYDTVALYDLGATGLSVTVIDMGTNRALGFARSTTVSGNMFDRVVREHLIRGGIIGEPETDAAAIEIDTFCRGIKESLSTASLAQTPGGDILLMTRGQFEQAVYLPLEESAKIISEVGLRCKRTAQAVVVIGGGARIPVVHTVLERWLGVPVVAADEPELVVAKGAALCAAGFRDKATAASPTPLPDALTGATDDDAPSSTAPKAPKAASTAKAASAKAAPAAKTAAAAKAVPAKPAKSTPAKSTPVKSTPAKVDKPSTAKTAAPKAASKPEASAADVSVADASKPDPSQANEPKATEPKADTSDTAAIPKSGNGSVSAPTASVGSARPSSAVHPAPVARSSSTAAPLTAGRSALPIPGPISPSPVTSHAFPAVPGSSPIARLRPHLPMFAGVVLSVFAAGSIGLWASSAPDLPASGGVGEAATTQDVGGTAPKLVPVPNGDATTGVPTQPVTPQSGPYTYPTGNVPLVTPNRIGGQAPTTTVRVNPTPLVLPSVDTVSTPRLRLTGF